MPVGEGWRLARNSFQLRAVSALIPRNPTVLGASHASVRAMDFSWVEPLPLGVALLDAKYEDGRLRLEV